MSLPLDTGRLNIRPLAQNDWDLFCHLYTDSEVMKHICEPLETVTLKQKFIERFVPWDKEQNTWHSLVVELTEDPTAAPVGIGLIALRTQNLETGIVEVNFMIDFPHSAKGYATEALGGIVSYAFNDLAFNKIVATCSVNHHNAQQALEANHFVKEGILRNNSLIGEQFVDDCYYGLLVNEVS